MKKWILFGVLLGALPVLSNSQTVAAPQKMKALKWPTFRQTASKKPVPEVTAIQYLLRARGFYPFKPDGVFGARTAASMRAFQRKMGLGADGVVASRTFSKLIVTLKRGDKGDAVRALQSLQREPMDETGEQQFKYHVVDGVFGRETDGLLREIQSNWIGYFGGRKTKIDGIAGPQTWCEMFGGDIE